MGCKLSVSVVHPESMINKIRESLSPKQKTKTVGKVDTTCGPSKPAPPDSPDSSVDIYKTIYLDSP